MAKPLFENFSFNLAASGWTTLAASAFSAFMAVGGGAAQAQDAGAEPPHHGGYSLAPTERDRGVMGAKAGEEEDMIMPHFQFFDVMKNMRGGSCCHMKDGLANLEVEETDNPAFPYRVQMTHTRSGLRLEEPVWIQIPAEKVLTVEHAQRVCEPYAEAAEAHGIESTCEPPPFSAIWISDNTSYDPQTGMHRIGYGQNGLVSSDYVVPAENFQPSRVHVYCFWNTPDMF